MGLIESCCIKPHGEIHDDNFTVYEKSIISSLKKKIYLQRNDINCLQNKATSKKNDC